MNDHPTPGGPVVFVGASELGRDAMSVLEGLRRAGRPVDFRGFVDDAPDLQGQEVCGHPVLGDVDRLMSGRLLPGETEPVAALLTIGDPAARETVARRLSGAGVDFVTLVHPTAVIGDTVTLGRGTLVMAAVTTTVDTRLGDHVVVNPSCSIAHDVTVADFAYLSPSVALAGRVEVGPRAHLGTGATVIPGRRVGADAVVGAGCVVIRDVAPGATVVGVPGRRLPGPDGEDG